MTYVGNAYDQDQILSNYGTMKKNMLCPDIAGYDLLTTNWLNFQEEIFSKLTFNVTVNTGYETVAANTYIQSSYMFPYYEPETYRSNGSKLLWTNEVTQFSFYDVTGTKASYFVQRLNMHSLYVYNVLWFDISSLSFLSMLGDSFAVAAPGAV